ncbi:sulfotransferase [Planktotalea sp.]|uniref:sulfotransferase family protein n=1 Tax=Planktotalea sp. TaxID=2029877 RepID=UPI003296B6CC
MGRSMNVSPKINFIIPGVQKSATTALSRFLSSHPRLLMRANEGHFFDRESEDWDRPNYSAYEEFAAVAEAGQLVGEKTPSYIFWPNAIERVFTYNPSMKFVTLLRNPVDRAFSHWKMVTQRGVETNNFSDAIREGRKRVPVVPTDETAKAKRSFSYVERGFYSPQIETLWRFFPKEQTLFILNEDLLNDPNTVFDKVCDFLSVDRFTTYPPQKIIRPNLNLAKGRAPGETKVTDMSESDRAHLAGIYREDILTTQNLLKIDLSAWLAR